MFISIKISLPYSADMQSDNYICINICIILFLCCVFQVFICILTQHHLELYFLKYTMTSFFVWKLFKYFGTFVFITDGRFVTCSHHNLYRDM